MSILLELFAEFKAKRRQRKPLIDPEQNQGALKVKETSKDYSEAGTGTSIENEIETEPAEESCELDFYNDESCN